MRLSPTMGLMLWMRVPWTMLLGQLAEVRRYIVICLVVCCGAWSGIGLRKVVWGRVLENHGACGVLTACSCRCSRRSRLGVVFVGGREGRGGNDFVGAGVVAEVGVELWAECVDVDASVVVVEGFALSCAVSHAFHECVCDTRCGSGGIRV